MYKNIFRITSFLLLTVLVSLSFSACAFGKLNIDDAKDALEDEDYSVEVSDDEEAGIVESLYASSEDYEDSVTIIVFEKAKTAKLYFKMLKLEQDFEKNALKAELAIQQHLLKQYDDDLSSDEIDELEDDIKEMKKELEELGEYVLKISGKTVWFGTPDAIKDARG